PGLYTPRRGREPEGFFGSLRRGGGSRNVLGSVRRSSGRVVAGSRLIGRLFCSVRGLFPRHGKERARFGSLHFTAFLHVIPFGRRSWRRGGLAVAAPFPVADRGEV